jgi:uncharacterized protein YecE (DUF72 family)
VPLIVGTSGWQYRDWRGAFYPERLPVSQWLEHYATLFPTVENNGTFYRLPVAGTVASWRARTPAGFVMAVKASRYLTHIRRLREPAEPVGRLLGVAANLGDRLGPVLLQLPPTMRADPAALDECLRQFAVQFASLAHSKLAQGDLAQSKLAQGDLAQGELAQGEPPASRPGQHRVCVEFRHESWLTQDVRDILTAHDAALCWSDRRGRPLGPLWRTADWGYLRFHEGAAQPWPHYGPQALRTWLRRIADTFPPEADVFAYFNNDQHAAAPADAEALMKLAGQAGWPIRQAPAGAGRRQPERA